MQRDHRLEFEAPLVDGHPIDDELGDAGVVGPELAHLANIYRLSPRALIWRQPSSEWRLFVVLLPLASRLSLMGNPIFAQLARAWGLNIRFIGIDRDHLVYDFRNLLSDRSLRLLIDALAHQLGPDLHPTFVAAEAARARSADDALDVLFATLAKDLLTVLDRRRDDWGRHLLREHRLESSRQSGPHAFLPDHQSLFDRASRFPDYLGRLREALREELIDTHFYGRALRSIDEREARAEQRLARLIEANLDAESLSLLARTPAGLHLGCYNWLRLNPRQAQARAHVLGRLPALASFFAESMLTVETLRQPDADDIHADDAEALGRADFDAIDSQASAGPPTVPTLDLRGLAARSDSLHSLRWGEVLRRAIDAGQDRTVIEALAQRFAVSDNVIRRVWRERPPIGTPPAWQLTQVLRELNQLSERSWPTDEEAWRALLARSVPAEAH